MNQSKVYQTTVQGKQVWCFMFQNDLMPGPSFMYYDNEQDALDVQAKGEKKRPKGGPAMTYDQAQAIAVQAMHQITERLLILDMDQDAGAFIDAIRRNVEMFNAAWERYQDGATE